jgi:predicted nucleic acid-binding protein
VEFLRNHPLVTVVSPEQAHFDKGLALYHARPDKGWSLTDCISFEIMQERNITRALSTDKHFEQAGFVAVLKQGY